MRLYDCKVMLSGSRDNEVRKEGVTAAEIMILRVLHGPDAVVDIQPKEMDKRPHGEERRRLFEVYVGAGENENLGGFQAERAKVLQGLFGPAHNPLPVELPQEANFVEEDDIPVKRVDLKKPLKAGRAEDVAAAAALT